MKIKQLKMLGKEEMLFPELVGKIAVRLPTNNTHRFPFMREKHKLIEAGNMLEKFIEQGDVILRKETTHEDGKFKTLNRVRIIGGKNKPKDLSKGFEDIPGVIYQKSVRNYRLKSEDKDVLSRASSIKFFRSEFATEEMLEAIQGLVPVDKKTMELQWKRKARYEEYRGIVTGMNSFHLPMKYDGRGRMYYEGASLEGFRPHGKAYESFLFELEARELTEQGLEVTSNLHYKEGLLKDLRTKQITKAVNTGITGMTVECDITNSGLLIAGILFRSKEMLKANNGYGLPEKVDSHKAVADVVGISREDAKGIQVQFLHGASLKSMANNLTEATDKTYTEEDMASFMGNVYGNAIYNINNIAQYGIEVMSNIRSQCSWTMPDGFRAVHRAYTTSVPLELQLKHRKVRLFSEMPLLLDGTGSPVYDQNSHGAKPATGSSEGTCTKIMGLYANIIHSIDSWVMREVIRSGIQLLCKHDAFFVHPNDVELLRDTLKSIYSDLYDFDLMKNILRQIEGQTGVKAPELFYGDAENRIKSSEHFLTVE